MCPGTGCMGVYKDNQNTFFLYKNICFLKSFLEDVSLFVLIPEDSEVAACQSTCTQARDLYWPPSPYSSFPHPFCLPLFKHPITRSVIHINSDIHRRCIGSMIHTCFLVEKFVGTPAAFKTFLKTQEKFVACIINILRLRETMTHTIALLNSQTRLARRCWLLLITETQKCHISVANGE